MASIDDLRGCVADLRQWAATEWQRAAADAAVAARYEQQAAQPPASLAVDRLRQAAMLRRVEACHQAAARLHERHATRLQAQLDKDEAAMFRRGLVMGAAAVLGIPSITIVLFGARRGVAVLAASDATARAAHDLEVFVGEGPERVVTGLRGPVTVTGPELLGRWPRFGPAVTGLGVQAVLAVPLLRGGGLGALCGYSREPVITGTAAAAGGRIAAAVGRALLQVAPCLRDSKGDVALRRFGLADDQAVVHQAAGAVAIACHCGIDDALALLRARAFANGQPVERVALAVVRDRLGLD